MSRLQHYHSPEPTRTNDHRFCIDYPLALLLLLLMGASLAVLYSAAGFEKMLDQSTRFLIGWAALLIIAAIPKGVIQFFTPFAYCVTVALLLAVHFFGVDNNGSQRWLNIGITQIQPSEIAKFSVPLMLAYYFRIRTLPPNWTDIGASLVIIALPVTFVYFQPDLGTSILVAASGLVLLFLAGISWKLITSALLIISGAAPIMWFYGMKAYQKGRVETFLNPESDPMGAGYNIIQSKIAIGSGGLEGRGYLNAVQSTEFLPERTTDFIFSVFAEEFGLVGVCALLGLYLLIIMRCLIMATRMTDNFSRLLCGALTMTFFFYCFINIGMVSGILPVVGLPLPLMSYGGTSILTLMLAFGLIMNLYGNRKTEKKHY